MPNGTIVILVALISVIAWNLITWYYEIPSSSSHALIGSIAGAAIVATGFGSINYTGFISIIKSLIISPILAFSVGYIMFTIFKHVFKNLNLAKTNRNFRRVQAITALVQTFAHGTNYAQKSMALGISVGRWKIIKTVGTQIVKIKPVNGAAAFRASKIGLPVSTTHVISSSIMGVGTVRE